MAIRELIIGMFFLNLVLVQQIRARSYSDRSNVRVNIDQQEQQIQQKLNINNTQSKRSQIRVKSTFHYYTLIYSYKLFQNYFIVRFSDENMGKIKQMVNKYFSNFINSEDIIAAFRQYYDQNIKYYIVYKSSIGKKFLVMFVYYPDDETIQFDRIQVLKLSGAKTNRRNCASSQDYNCKVCEQKFSLFMGRCHLQQRQCLNYDPQECFKCIPGYILERGSCVKDR